MCYLLTRSSGLLCFWSMVTKTCVKEIQCNLLSTSIPVSTDCIDDFDQSSDLDKCEDDEDIDEFYCLEEDSQQIQLRPSKQL